MKHPEISSSSASSPDMLIRLSVRYDDVSWGLGGLACGPSDEESSRVAQGISNYLALRPQAEEGDEPLLDPDWS